MLTIRTTADHEFTAINGSLYVMSVASQALWRHRIEKCDAFTGRRFSITLRTVDEKFRKSTVILGVSNTKYINFGEGNGSLGYITQGIIISVNKKHDLYKSWQKTIKNKKDPNDQGDPEHHNRYLNHRKLLNYIIKHAKESYNV